MKSCFAGLYLDGFDFIRGLVLGFHLNEVKISSLPRNDFIKPTEKEITFRLRTDLLSLSVVIKGWLSPYLRLTSQMRCLHFAQSINSPLRTSPISVRVILFCTVRQIGICQHDISDKFLLITVYCKPYKLYH